MTTCNLMRRTGLDINKCSIAISGLCVQGKPAIIFNPKDYDEFVRKGYIKNEPTKKKRIK